MPFYNYRCCKCRNECKLFHAAGDKSIKECTCGYVLNRIINTNYKKKDVENTPELYQTAEDCVKDSKEELMRELEDFKNKYKDL